MPHRTPLLTGLGPVLFALLALPAAAVEDDAYLAGYASAVIERELGLEVTEARVEDGTATLRVRSLEGVAPQQIAAALVRIEGIERARVLEDGESEPLAEAEREKPEQPEEPGLEFFPSRELFDPLLADPRQPHFSASLHWYLEDPELTRVGSANFGETFALVGGPLGDAGTRWELGILGAVFSIFDLDAPSSDLINSDFWVAPTFSLRHGPVSSQLRVYHQSSHLGDEFLLRNRAERVNLSYEGVDLLVSADLHQALRVYGGVGTILHSDPDLDRWSGQAGFELTSPVAFLGDHVRPLAGADVQLEQENNWDPAYAAAAGFQLESPLLSRLRLQLLAEYFRGNSPNGQFYERRIEYVGFGVHLHH